MAKRKCKGETKKGTPCPNAPGESGYCFTHDPDRARERAAARRRGGQNRLAPKVADSSVVKTPIRDVPGVLAILDVAVLDTLAQANTPQRTRALVAVAVAYLKSFEVGDLEKRMEELERALKGKSDETQIPTS